MRKAGRRPWLLLLAVTAGGLLPPACGAGRADAPLRVSAAVSLTGTLEQAALAFERATGRRVALNFAASNVLAQQVIEGAPIDVFISADERQMARVRGQGLAAGPVVPLWGNRLVVVAPAGQQVPASMPEALADPRVRRIAIGDPAGVPAGVYATQWLQRIGLWARVEPKVVPSASVRAALAAVAAGNADAGIVYATDAAGHAGVAVVHEVAGEAAPRIVYPAVVLTSSSQPRLAHDLIMFLRDSDEARRIFSRAGFVLPQRRAS